MSVRAPGARAGFVRADVRELPLSGFDAIFVDPARRDSQRRLAPGQYRPPTDWCLRLRDAAPPGTRPGAVSQPHPVVHHATNGARSAWALLRPASTGSLGAWPPHATRTRTPPTRRRTARS